MLVLYHMTYIYIYITWSEYKYTNTYMLYSYIIIYVYLYTYIYIYLYIAIISYGYNMGLKGSKLMSPNQNPKPHNWLQKFYIWLKLDFPLIDVGSINGFSIYIYIYIFSRIFHDMYRYTLWFEDVESPFLWLLTYFECFGGSSSQIWGFEARESEKYPLVSIQKTIENGHRTSLPMKNGDFP